MLDFSHIPNKNNVQIFYNNGGASLPTDNPLTGKYGTQSIPSTFTTTNTINLTAGTPYFFRAREQTGTGGAGLVVGYQRPSQTAVTVQTSEFTTTALTLKVFSTNGGTGKTDQYAVNPTSILEFDKLFDTSYSNTVLTNTYTINASICLNWPNIATLTTGTGVTLPNSSTYFSTEITGIFVPIETGIYTFGIRSDDGGDLILRNLSPNWQTWIKPKNAKMVYIMCVGAGGGGGGGRGYSDGGATVRGGGAGGTSGIVTTATYPASLLPDILYIKPGLGGSGGTGGVGTSAANVVSPTAGNAGESSIVAMTTLNTPTNIVCISAGGKGGSAGAQANVSSITPVPSITTTATTNAFYMATGQFSSTAASLGGIGSGTAGVTGGDIAALSTTLVTGGGGGGAASTGGGKILSSSVFLLSEVPGTPSTTTGTYGYKNVLGSPSIDIRSFGLNGNIISLNSTLSTTAISGWNFRSFSLFLWIKPTGDGIVVDETNFGGYHTSQIEIINGVLNFGLWTGALSSFSSTISLDFNSWNYIGLTYDGTTLKGYTNGQPAGSKAINRSTPSSGTTYVIGLKDGTNMGSGVQGNFAFREFQLFTSVLTDTQILNNYTSPTLSPSPKIYYNIANNSSYPGTGDTITDLSATMNATISQSYYSENKAPNGYGMLSPIFCGTGGAGGGGNQLGSGTSGGDGFYGCGGGGGSGAQTGGGNGGRGGDGIVIITTSTS